MSNAYQKSFESQTKLLITGEYFVLRGAQALALPLKFSQKLMVNAGNEGPILAWESKIHGQHWFSASLLPDFSVKETTSKSLSYTLSGILKAAASLNSNFKIEDPSCRVISDMNFNPGWGVGSSSSLVSNIAHWAECDPFELNNLTFNGSGYDIACARSIKPIVYEKIAHLPTFREVNFQPTFHQNLYFIYLNRKQNSRTSIQELDLSRITPTGIQTVNRLTDELIAAKDLQNFQQIMEEHEEMTGKILRKESVQKLLFPDFQGAVKSLGAWGGDFVMAASNAPEAYVRNYFHAREFNTIFNYREIVSI